MRLFIALPLPHHVERFLESLIADFRSRTRPGAVSWVSPGNIHITLRFLGETDPKLLPDVRRVVSVAAETSRAEQITCNRVGAFPSLRKPNVLWIGSSEVPESLRSLAQKIESDVQHLGFDKEAKPFKPHLTLGRVRQPHLLGSLPDYMTTYSLSPQTILLDRVVLFQSTLTPQGAIYKALCEVTLPNSH